MKILRTRSALSRACPLERARELWLWIRGHIGSMWQPQSFQLLPPVFPAHRAKGRICYPKRSVSWYSGCKADEAKVAGLSRSRVSGFKSSWPNGLQTDLKEPQEGSLTLFSPRAGEFT